MFRDFRNRVDYFMRNQITWGRPLNPQHEPPEESVKLQREVTEFFNLFHWKPLVSKIPNSHGTLVVADVGAKTFVLAPAIHQLFADFEKTTEIHGIEVDAYRRFVSFRTRFDYGQYFAARTPNSFYYSMDYLKWTMPLDIAFVLHPFVTEEPLLRWGLPKTLLKPQALMDHTAHLLESSPVGLMLLSCPTEEEYEISLNLAKKSGFRFIEEQLWQPNATSLQRKPRIGALMSIA